MVYIASLASDSKANNNKHACASMCCNINYFITHYIASFTYLPSLLYFFSYSTHHFHAEKKDDSLTIAVLSVQ